MKRGEAKSVDRIIESIRTGLNKKNTQFSKLVTEDYQFNDEMDDSLESEEDVDIEDVDSDVQEPVSVSSLASPFIKEIRKVCLNAINELSEDPTSSEYDTFKKIWDMCDKMYINTKKSK